MRVHMPLGKPQPWVMPVTLVCLALGALIASKLRISPDVTEAVDPNKMRPEQLIMYYSQMKRENDELQVELIKTRTKYDEFVNAAGDNQKQIEELQKEINMLRVYAGSTPVEGPGIEITIDDSKSVKINPAEVTANALLTHDMDLLMLVNELRGSGAEAIEINGRRVVASSAIRCVGPVIQVNNRNISAPFVVRAIGKTDVLYGGVMLPFGVLDQLKQLEMQVKVEKREKIRIPAITILPTLEVGKAVPDSPEKGEGKQQ